MKFDLYSIILTPISWNLTEVEYIYKPDLGKVLWNGQYLNGTFEKTVDMRNDSFFVGYITTKRFPKNEKYEMNNNNTKLYNNNYNKNNNNNNTLEPNRE